MKVKKTILVTGSEGNAGSAVVKKFKENGWNVVGIDIKDESGRISDADKYYICDVRSPKSLGLIVDEIVKEYVEINALFTAVGMQLNKGFMDTSFSEWKDLVETVLGGVGNACAAVGPHMIRQKSGKIIILSPDYKWVEGDCIMNAAADGSLHGFAKSFGTEVAEDNVMVNALSPNLPFDMEALTSTAYYLAEMDNYTTAQVVSVNGKKEEVHHG